MVQGQGGAKQHFNSSETAVTDQTMWFHFFHHLNYKFMECFCSYRQDTRMGNISSEGWGGIKSIITEANN